MKQKIFVFLLAVVFLFSQVTVVEARGSRGRSFGGGFSKSSSGYFGSSKSKSSGGLFSKKSSGSSKSSSGYTGSSKKNSSSSGDSSRSTPGSYSTGSNTKSKNSFFSGSKSKKSSYMQDTYNKQASSSKFNSYKQNLNSEQKRVYDSTMNTNYRVKDRMSFEDAMQSRPTRINNFNKRPIFINVNRGYFGGPMGYGSAFIGPWDMFFLMTASHMFWYHHWNEIRPYRDHFNQAEFDRLEARVKELERENNGIRDPNYMEPGIDPDLQFSKEYQQKHLDNIYYTNKYSQPATNPFAIILVILVIAIVLIIILKKVSRPKPKKTYHSRLY
ncbi:MAG: hypothetical protein N3I35_01445 [Clostridia bacterium]|nr:hypothetical protein [Clostridia bacterium]